MTEPEPGKTGHLPPFRDPEQLPPLVVPRSHLRAANLCVETHGLYGMLFSRVTSKKWHPRTARCWLTARGHHHTIIHQTRASWQLKSWEAFSMTDELLLDPRSREILKVWLQGRERIKTLPRFRWNELICAASGAISYRELSQIVDCTSSEILDLLLVTKPLNTI